MKTKREGLILLGIFFITLISFSSSFGATVTYTYDSLNRLTKATYDNGATEEFTYDPDGNRLSYVVNVIDVSGPSLTITSHSDGQHVNTASITLAGTASDSGKGDNGISQVTVNGSRVNNDSAAGNGTANWSKATNLNPGANTITVVAYDNSTNQNQTTRTISVFYDTTPTAQTNAATGVTAAGATLNGTVNANNFSTTVTFQYGLTTAYGTTVTATQSPVTGSSNTVVSKGISGLTPNTTYHFRVVGVNAGGTVYAGDLTFTTTAAAPTVTTKPATGVTATGATLNGTVNPNGLSTTYYFQWGLTTAYGNSTSSQSAGSGTSNVVVSTPLIGLTPNATYHYRIVATNNLGTTYGADITFNATINPLPWLRLLLENEKLSEP